MPYHLELRQFPHVARAFNLEREALDIRFLRPWVAGSIIDYEERRWSPDRTKLTVLEGPPLAPDELGMGRGWANANRTGADVTAEVIAEVERGARARPELEALKDAVAEVASGRLGFQDVMALAAAAQPHWRASEQLGLAEQAVWEMLHQGRLEMLTGTEAVDRDRWQSFVLSWATWAGTSEPTVSLRAPAPGR